MTFSLDARERGGIPNQNTLKVKQVADVRTTRNLMEIDHDIHEARRILRDLYQPSHASSHPNLGWALT